MRVVFDTNVVLSAMLWGGPPRVALDVVRRGEATLLTSIDLDAELRLVLKRAKFGKRLREVGQTPDTLMLLYSGITEIVEPAVIGRVVPEDPKDDMVLACAVGGQALLVVSGDSHLLNLKRYQEVRIITVEQFLALHR